MKKLLLAALMMAAVLSGCAETKPKIGLLMYDATDTFMVEMQDKILEELGDDYAAEVKNAEKNQLVQNQQILELCENGAQLLIINMVDRLASSAVSEKCAKENVPIIFLNREPLATDIADKKSIFYVGAAAESLGEKQAVMVHQLFQGDFAMSKFDKNMDGMVQVIVLKGEQGHQDAEKRTEKCIEVLKYYGYSVEVMEIKIANWKRGEAKLAMEELYEKFGDDIELIFSNNDDMALGAIDFLNGKGLVHETLREYEQDFIIIGVDGTKQGLEAVEKGYMYGTILNDATAQSDAVVKLIDYILNGKNFIYFPYEITKGQFIYIDGKPMLRNEIN